MGNIKEIVENLPGYPGVYQFFNADGKIIYIGKAKNLKNRVSSYFTKSKYDSYKTKVLSEQVADIRHIVVDTESDALLLENNLIKKYQPKYNILLKDDKTFPWICIKNEPFPRIFSTRKLIKDGSVYLGPYTSALMVRTLLNLIRELYQLRTCSYNLTESNILSGKFKKCLEYHIGNCKAPCENLQTEQDYNESIKQIKEILKGNIHEVIDYLKKIMEDLASSYKFEEAENIKQKIQLLERYKSKSTIVNPRLSNIDVYSYIEQGKHAFVNFIKVIQGAVVQSHTIEMIRKLDESKDELLLFAINDIKAKVSSSAKNILVPFIPSEYAEDLKLSVPKSGDKKKLLELSERNCKQYILHKNKVIESKSFDKRTTDLLERAKVDLRLKYPPKRIECFDNSNIQGSNPVAACVVFLNGKPAKREYRHFNIKSVQGPNDFASMEEIIFRRYKRSIEENSELPGLIIIDGGKGQLSAAVKSLNALNIYNQIAVIGIAKRLEEIYFPGDPVPLYLDKNSTTLKLIQNLRNEAHRFGITFHRKKRSLSMLKSDLENIPGVGEKSIEKLLGKFRDVETISNVPLKELKDVIGIKIGTAVYEYFKRKT